MINTVYSTFVNSKVIIGSGPVGATAALNLLRQGKAVLMLDIGDFSKEDSPSFAEAKRLNLKLSYNQSQPYDFNEFNVLLGEQRKWFSSKAKGGHSLVWGATWDSITSEADIEWEEALEKSTALLKNHFVDLNSAKGELISACSCFDHILAKNKRLAKTPDFEVRKSQLAVNGSTCTLSGLCHDQCHSNSIWSSLELLKSCEEFGNFTYMPNVFVEDIKVIGDIVMVNTKTNSFLAEEVFLAAGPIGNALILLRSKFANEIRLSDTQMITIPIISFMKKKNHKGSFGLAGLTINGKSRKGHLYHVQVYAHPETFEDRILMAIPKPLRVLSRFMLKTIMSRLFIGIVYLDPKISGELILEMKDTPIYSKLSFTRKSKEVKEIKKVLSRKLIELQLLPAWHLGIIAGVGESYHVGATKSLNISKYGEIDGIAKIKILGSLALSEIKPGPITSHSMAQAFLSTYKI